MKQLAMHHQVTKLHSMGRTLLKLNYFHQRLKYVLLHQEQNTTPVVHHVLDLSLHWMIKILTLYI